jgi:hypothetical protein
MSRSRPMYRELRVLMRRKDGCRRLRRSLLGDCCKKARWSNLLIMN